MLDTIGIYRDYYSSFLLLVVMPLLLEAMHLLLSCWTDAMQPHVWCASDRNFLAVFLAEWLGGPFA